VGAAAFGIGDRVRVKSGYARNYLIPHGKATLATAANIAKFESRRAELEAKAAAELAAAQARAKKLEGLVLKIEMQAGAEGKLFGSVGTVDIAEEIGKRGISIERSEIRLPDGPLRLIGEHQVELHLHTDVNVGITVVIEAAEADKA